MTKATHKGTCQVCGNVQKLPGGHLSLHGYTKRWGFFSGTCYGANEKPFELSKDLVVESIARAKDQAADCLRLAYEAEASASEVWIPHRENYSRIWIKRSVDDVTISEDETLIEYKCNRGYDHRARMHPVYNTSRVKSLNKQRAKDYRQEARSIESYIKWQERRIEGWTPQPEKLIEV